MSILRIIAVFLILTSCTGCSQLFRNPFSSDDDDSGRPSSVPDRVANTTNEYYLAIGGVAPGGDELVIEDDNGDARNFSGQTLECKADDDIVILRPRPGFDTVTAGSGVLMVATSPGITAIHCTLDGQELQEIYEVIISPQSLIQILVAEAGTQLKDEADIDSPQGKSIVRLTSTSPTGNALGTVIRNRINLINSTDDPELFAADPDDYDTNPPASYYDSVILAKNQFSPTDTQDPNHKVFEDAQDRNFLEPDTQIAYDQAVITAAHIFSGDTPDSTGGSFAFRSPTQAEWSAVLAAWTGFSLTTPDASGFSDLDFPALAPIQVLIHPNIWKYSDGRPSFILARRRMSENYAVTNIP